MGGASSTTFFPRAILDCTEANLQEGDARYDYACGANSSVRMGLTLLHLTILCIGFFIFVGCVLCWNRYDKAKTRHKMYSLPGRRMPMPEETASRALYKKTVLGLVDGLLDDDAIPQPSRGNAIDGAITYGTRTTLHRHALDIGADLLAFAQQAISSAARCGVVGGNLAVLRAERRLHSADLFADGSAAGPVPRSLREAAPLLVKLFSVDAIDLSLVVFTTERAQVLGAAADPSPEDFQEFRQRVWRITQQVEEQLAVITAAAQARDVRLRRHRPQAPDIAPTSASASASASLMLAGAAGAAGGLMPQVVHVAPPAAADGVLAGAGVG